MIRFEGVTKTFRSRGLTRTIVRDLWMTIPRGRNLALLGRNGAGKSSFLNLIAGTLRPDEGRVAREVGVSWPLGFSSFHPQMTGRQNVTFVARIYGVDEGELVASAAAFAEIGPWLDQPVSTYSSGMRARLAFGVVMGIDFEVYLVDELTAVGDADFKAKCKTAFARKLSRADVIMVSHSPGTLRDFCDCGVVLEDGRLEYFDDIEDALALHADNMRGRRAGPVRRRGHARRRAGAAA